MAVKQIMSDQFFIDGEANENWELYESVEELFTDWFADDDRDLTDSIYRVDKTYIEPHAEFYTSTEDRGDNHKIVEYGIITYDGKVTLFETELKKN